ncbi:MAG: 16S rRNA (uracil(1498)-N(3))-methyltransferase [Balneolia bacterium]|nr:16S rRNA (uracil(1498)-N(3))-methyltransferase [Balneolia bacterium]
MHTFFASDLVQSSVFADLSKEEAHHALQVLRLKAGDEIWLFNGRGLKARANLIPEGKRKARAEILETVSKEKASPRISLCLGLIKNRTRLEWACEKLTETGVDDIKLLDTERTERSKFRIDRLEGILMNAAKQSLSFWLPELSHENLGSFLDTVGDSSNTAYIIAHEKLVSGGNTDKDSFSFAELKDELSSAGYKRLVLFVGPEGGFSDDEVSRILSMSNSFPLWLGEQRLRAETAAVQIAGLFKFAL